MMYYHDYDIVLNIFLCVVDMVLLWELREQLYGRIRRGRKLCALSAAILIGILMLLPSKFENSMYVVPASWLLLPFYPKDLKKKLFFETWLFSILFSCLMILNDFTNMLPKFSHWVMTYLLIVHVVIWLVLFFCLRWCRSIATDLPLSLWILFLFIPILSFASSVTLIVLFNGNSVPRPVKDLCHLVIQTTFLFIDLALLVFMRRFTEFFQREKERQLLKQQLRLQEAHYKELIGSAEHVRRIRHDMKNHLNTISLLYSEGRQEELADYLHTVSDRIGQTEQVVSTGNPAFDAVLNIKLGEMKEKGISCSPSLSVPQNMGLPFSDTVTILGNLLDNAIHAAVDQKEQTNPAKGEALVISLSVTWQHGSLLLHLINPCMETAVPEYGIGMKNVEETVNNYSGTMQTDVQNGEYITDIILYLPAPGISDYVFRKAPEKSPS